MQLNVQVDLNEEQVDLNKKQQLTNDELIKDNITLHNELLSTTKALKDLEADKKVNEIETVSIKIHLYLS